MTAPTHFFCRCPEGKDHLNVSIFGQSLTRDFNTTKDLFSCSNAPLTTISIEDLTPITKPLRDTLTKEEIADKNISKYLDDERVVAFTATLVNSNGIAREVIESALEGKQTLEMLPPLFVNFDITLKEKEEGQDYSIYLEIVDSQVRAQREQTYIIERDRQNLGEPSAKLIRETFQSVNELYQVTGHKKKQFVVLTKLEKKQTTLTASKRVAFEDP